MTQADSDRHSTLHANFDSQHLTSVASEFGGYPEKPAQPLTIIIIIIIKRPPERDDSHRASSRTAMHRIARKMTSTKVPSSDLHTPRGPMKRPTLKGRTVQAGAHLRLVHDNNNNNNNNEAPGGGRALRPSRWNVFETYPGSRERFLCLRVIWLDAS